MSNTIQYNGYHRIAVKRDAAAVAQTRYGFYYKHWDVLIGDILYQFASSTPTNGVYTLKGPTNVTIPENEIKSTVYEGMVVKVNIPGSTQQSTGALHINSSHFNYACTKSTVEQTPGCSLKSPSLDYTAKRLVREEDIIKNTDTVTFYFDENYIDVECFTKSGIPEYAIVSGSYATGYRPRTANDSLTVSEQRSYNSRSYITCHNGDTIKIISKSKALKNVAVRLYTNVGNNFFPPISKKDENGKDVITFNLQKGESVDYTITANWFITFDIGLANYNLFGSVLDEPEFCDSCVVKVNDTDFIIAGVTDEAKRPIQENSRVNINTSLSIYTVEVRAKKRDYASSGEYEYIIVNENNNPIQSTTGSEVYVHSDEYYNGKSLLANSQGQIILSDNTSLPLVVEGWYNLIDVINLTTKLPIEGLNPATMFEFRAEDKTTGSTVTDLSTLEAGTYEVTVEFHGIKQYCFSSNTTFTLVVEKATANVGINNCVVGYEAVLNGGLTKDELVTITSNTLKANAVDHVYFAVGLDVLDGTLSAYVDFTHVLSHPNAMIQGEIDKQLRLITEEHDKDGDGLTVAEFYAYVEALCDLANIKGINFENERLNSIVDKLSTTPASNVFS